MDWLAYLCAVLGGYLIGSIPTGYLAGKARGIDIRKEGSGNIGATNVFRILGKKAGTGVLLADALKGWLSVGVIGVAVHQIFSSGPGSATTSPSMESLQMVAGISAILGHNYTLWLRFRGGKGIATTGGVLIGLIPYAFLVVLAIWVVVFWASRYVSLASVVAAVALPVCTWFINGNKVLAGVTLFLGLMAIYKHRTNIKRLLNGTESRFGKKKEAVE